ncbi:hypothetical protein ACFLYR_06715 [Chloroflexota bacterium]
MKKSIIEYGAQQFVYRTLFIVLWLLLFVYILLFRSNSIIFWFIALSIAAVVILQTFQAKNGAELTFIRTEIIILCVTLQLMTLVYAGLDNLYWLDSYFEIAATTSIVKNGWNPNILGSVGPYPSLHFLAAFLWEITGVELIDIARYIGILFSTLSLVFYLLIVETIFKNRKAALFSGIAFIYLFYFVMEAGFGRMPLATTLFFLCLFLLVKSSNIPSVAISILIMLCVIASVFAHLMPLTILVIYLALLALMVNFIRHIMLDSSSMLDRFESLLPIEMKAPSVTIVLIGIVGILMHFVYFSYWAQESILHQAFTIIIGVEAPRTIGTGGSTSLNWRIFLYGQGMLGFIFAFIVFKSKALRSNLPSVFFILFAGLMTALAFISYYLNIEFIRFTLYIWPFALMAMGYFVVKSKQILSSLLLIFFIIINIFGYYPFIYDKSIEREYSAGQWRRYITYTEKSAVRFGIEKGLTSNVPDEYYAGRHVTTIVGNYYFNQAFLQYKQIQIILNPQFYHDLYMRPKVKTWFYLSQEDRRLLFLRQGIMIVPDTLYLAYQNTSSMIKLYNNGQVEIYEVSPP